MFDSWSLAKTAAVCLFLWCKSYHHGWFQATKLKSSNTELGRNAHDWLSWGLMLKLKLQYFGHLMGRTNLLEKTLMLGKIEGGRRRGQQRMRWWMSSPTQWTWVWVNSGSWWWTGAGSRREAFHSWQRSWGRRLGICKGGIKPQESPWIFSSIYPQKTRVCLLYCFVLLPLTLLGAVPHHHLALSVKELTYSSN